VYLPVRTGNLCPATDRSAGYIDTVAGNGVSAAGLQLLPLKLWLAIREERVNILAVVVAVADDTVGWN
jgi:hypothetical protein